MKKIFNLTDYFNTTRHLNYYIHIIIQNYVRRDLKDKTFYFKHFTRLRH